MKRYLTWGLVITALLSLVFVSCTRRKKPKSTKFDKNGKNPAEKFKTKDGQKKMLAQKGEQLYKSKGCVACHTVDGTPRVGPTLKGLHQKERVVITNGKERTLKADTDYLVKAIIEPDADIVKGYNPGQMVLVQPVNKSEAKAIAAYIEEISRSDASMAGGDMKKHGLEILQHKGCLTCHSLDGTRGIAPTFKGIVGRKETVSSNGKSREITIDAAYIKKSILEPNADIVKGYHPYMMPAIKIGDDEIDAIFTYLKTLKGKGDSRPGTLVAQKGADRPPITMEEMDKASKIYFNKCAGCHGMLRKGATGPGLLPKQLKKKFGGTEGIKAIVNYGLPGGMPAWGKLGLMKPEEIDLIGRFLQHTPPDPPEMSIDQMKKTWKVHIPVDKRPKSPQTKRDWRNYFGVVLRDAGKVAIIDGDTKELVNIVNTGFAVHILRSSATGRYFYSIGRDGKVTMIDLWMEKPDTVAEVKVCYDARSVESSKYKGKLGDYRDKYLVVGGYWPPSLVIMNGQTLEPLKLACTSSYTYDTYEYQREARAAAIISSHHDPLWVVNIKETGYVWLVDYTDIENLKITAIEAERFLHDGGWDQTRRYALMAANGRNTISVVDTVTKKLVKNIKVGKIPHPGRGANVDHPKYGRIWLTGHLGDNTVQAISTDPKNPKAWTVVKTIELPTKGGGNLFIKTHPNSPHIWVDRPLFSGDPKITRTVYVIDKKSLKVIKTLTLPKKYKGRAVHFEYNRQGTEIWVSAWSHATKVSGLVIYDDKKLEIIKEITGKWLITPTGKFNVENSTKDIY